MTYVITRTDGTTLVTLPDQTIDATSTSLQLVGRGAVGYGAAHAENFVRLLENFAYSEAPSSPLVGQLWYDSASKALRLWEGTDTGWATFSPTIISAGANVLRIGQVDTTAIIAGGQIIAIISAVDIAVNFIPSIGMVAGNSYPLRSRFPSGIRSGITLATDPAAPTVFSGTLASYSADLAERYAADEPMDAGDVVALGGTAEITKTASFASHDVFGIVSTKPAVRLNDATNDPLKPFVALAGRVPCKVIGPVRKGQRIVSSSVPGVARGIPDSNIDARAVIGRALSDEDSVAVRLVEVVLGAR